jgi:hypothetical protein
MSNPPLNTQMTRIKKMFDEAGLELSPEELENLNNAQQWPQAFVGATYDLYSSKMLAKALHDHVEALNNSAAAANKHGASLKGATRALVIVTLGLVIIAGIQLYLALN